MNLAYWLNTGWLLACTPAARAFHGATQHVAKTQADLLLRCLRENQDTAFGRAFDFASIQTPRDYQRRVPLTSYDTLSDAVGRIAAGEDNVLTREPVMLLEPTSGTTSGEKLIPYTASLRKQFQRGIAPWIADLLTRRPELRNGRMYWSISPAFGPERRTSGGIPIGFDDDTAYLGFIERFTVSRLLAVPPSVARLGDLDRFRYATLLHLLRAEDLTLMSIWNPTFLTALMRPLESWLERLCHDIRNGDEFPGNPARADALLRIWREGANTAQRLRAIWPNLQLISCWMDAAASSFVPELRELFPHVELQPKGLIATEAFVSFPLFDHPGAALAVTSHFFEFQEANESGVCRLAHELERGGRYRVIVTTAGGLYRYQLRDEVEIVGFVHQCPLLKLLGKADLVSDLCGEKLAEPFVRSTLERCWTALGRRPKFYLLTPVAGKPPRYRLYTQGLPASVQAAVQRALEENPHYRYACGLGQLAPVEIYPLHDDADGWRLYERGCLGRGQKLGNIKPTVLDARFGWEGFFSSERHESTVSGNGSLDSGAGSVAGRGPSH